MTEVRAADPKNACYSIMMSIKVSVNKKGALLGIKLLPAGDTGKLPLAPEPKLNLAEMSKLPGGHFVDVLGYVHNVSSSMMGSKKKNMR